MNHAIIKEMPGYNVGFMILIKQRYPRLQNRVLSLLIHIVGFPMMLNALQQSDCAAVGVVGFTLWGHPEVKLL